MKYLFVIGSVTAASRLVKELNKIGINNIAVINTPTSISNGGCSYSIKANESDKELIYQAAMRRKIAVKAIYKEMDGDKYENIS